MCFASDEEPVEAYVVASSAGPLISSALGWVSTLCAQMTAEGLPREADY
jgi:hypothetical protein